MVARGDLGVGAGSERASGSERLVRACRAAAKPVMVATNAGKYD